MRVSGALLTPAFPPLPPPGGIAGDAILLFTLTFDAIAPGISDLNLGATPGDLSEGFALATGGFADVNFVPGTVEVVATSIPEPGTWLLILTGLLLLAWQNLLASPRGASRVSPARDIWQWLAAGARLDPPVEETSQRANVLAADLIRRGISAGVGP